MGSLHKIDIGGLLAGRRHLVADDRVPLEPFEGISFPDPARVHLELHGARDLLEIGGTVDVLAHGECGRCLGDVDRAMHVDLDEQLEVGEGAQADPFGESNVLSGDRLDVANLTTQVVCSAIPLGLLCDQECRGICPDCGENRNLGACSCAPGNGEV